MTVRKVPREPRSYLYVPGDAQDKLDRSLERGADSLIVDLEDAVVPQAKERARCSVRKWLEGQAPAAERDVEILVRINRWPVGEEDLEAVVCGALNGVCLPKGVASDIAELDRALGRAEAAASLAPGSLSVQAIVESAGAVLGAVAVAMSPRVERIQLGEMDLAADLGAEPDSDGTELLFARAQVVLASAAAGIGAPVGPVQAEFGDSERFVRTTAALKRLGFGSRACIHPSQVELANRIFTPTAAELERAQAVLARYEEAVGTALGAFVGPGGEMVDEASARLARRLIARARSLAGGFGGGEPGAR